MTKKYFIGIDNGLNGGVAVLDSNAKIVELIRMPIIKTKNKREYDITEIKNTIKKYLNKGNVYCSIEKAHVRPISGKRACFMTGFCYGVMQAIIQTLGVPFVIVTPKTWQKNIRMYNSNIKLASIQGAKNMFPNVNLKPGKMKKEHDGLSDALHIALYCLGEFG